MTNILTVIGAATTLRFMLWLLYAMFLKSYGPSMSDILRRVPPRGLAMTRPQENTQ